ncbi:MAG TPA: 50S ribosomal protein L6, partial [Candidatus Magasanikbacteria bacterium]|nr:50S ribosomal protein L6 [Candidatus Magasanikbacteria bacterium]
MSRIGKKTIEIPQGVTVTIANDVVKVQGPKGTLERRIHPLVSVSVTDNVVAVDVVQKEEKKERSLWGTFGAHIRNMIEGVTTGFKKELEVNGVGYKVAMQGTDLKLDLGFSHPVIYKIPATVQASVEKNVMTLVSADKELLGATAAEIRSIRKPEPYKG